MDPQELVNEMLTGRITRARDYLDPDKADDAGGASSEKVVDYFLSPSYAEKDSFGDTLWFSFEEDHDKSDIVKAMGGTDEEIQEYKDDFEFDDDYEAADAWFTQVTDNYTELSQFIHDVPSRWPKLLDMMSEWMERRSGDSGLRPQEALARQGGWEVMESPELIHGEWMIHFSDDCEAVMDIAKEGFKHGVSEDKMRYLHYTGADDAKEEDPRGDISFAYKYDSVGNAYSTGSFVMFRANGMQYFHTGDMDNQIIFDNKTAKDIVPVLTSWHNSIGYYIPRRGAVIEDFDKKPRRDQVLIQFKPEEDAEDVARWIKNNYEQYRKHMDFRTYTAESLVEDLLQL